MEYLISLITTFINQVQDGFGRVWVFGFLPALFLLYLLAGVISIRYSSGAGIAREIRSFRRQSAFSWLQESMRRYFKLAGVLTFLVVILPPFIYFNIRHDIILDQLSENLGTLISMVIGLTTIVLTVSVVIILFHKNYYLVFTISDVLRSYHFTEYLGMLLASCLGVCICAMLQMYLSAETFVYKLVMLLLEWCILTSLVTSGLSFRVIFLVMFSNSKVELHLLDRLYRIFRGESEPEESSSSGARNWERAAVRTNVEYLCAEYVSSARILPVHKVLSFRYLNGDARARRWDELYHNILKTFIFTAMGIWLVSMIVVSIVLGRDGSGILLMNTLLMAVVTALAYLGFRVHGVDLQLLFDDTLGYEMVIQRKQKTREKNVRRMPDPPAADSSVCADDSVISNGKRIRIPRIKFTPDNKYDRYVQHMNSLTAFFRIGIERGMTPEMTRDAIAVMIDWLSDVKERHHCLYLPVFAAGYYAYCSGMEMMDVRDCFRRLCKEKPDACSGLRTPEAENPDSRGSLREPDAENPDARSSLHLDEAGSPDSRSRLRTRETKNPDSRSGLHTRDKTPVQNELEEMIRGHLADLTRDSSAKKHSAADPVKSAADFVKSAADTVKSAADSVRPDADSVMPDIDSVKSAMDSAKFDAGSAASAAGSASEQPAIESNDSITAYLAWLCS